MYLLTSEAVSKGHPDKVADQIADAILDAYLAVDPYARVASEVMVMKDLCVLGGEISSTAKIDIESVVRNKIVEIGYDRLQHYFNGNKVEILNKINTQSPEIANAVIHGKEILSGDQGFMIGYACNETEQLMPLSHSLAFEIIHILEKDIELGRANGKWESPLNPDAKSQVTIEYNDNGTPNRIHTVVISTCHTWAMTYSELIDYISLKVIKPLKLKYPHLFSNEEETNWLINPAGRWTIGGPAADTGLTGRKIVVDSYGGLIPIGGGAYSGKDVSKVDRSGAYAARHIAKNLVAAGLATKATVQVSYAIGVAEPISVRVVTEGSFDNKKLEDMVSNLVDLTPQGIIERFDLRRPIYAQTASGGHFGHASYPWEQLDLVEKFTNYLM